MTHYHLGIEQRPKGNIGVSQIRGGIVITGMIVSEDPMNGVEWWIYDVEIR